MARAVVALSEVTGMGRHLLEHLEQVAGQFRENPDDLLERAFPGSEPAFDPRQIVGPRGELEPERADLQAARLAEERAALLEAGARALPALTDGRFDELDEEARAGVEAMIAVARPALYLYGGRFDPPPPPWAGVLQREAPSIATTAASVGRIGAESPESPGSGSTFIGTGFLVGAGTVMTNCHVAQKFSDSTDGRSWTIRPGTRVTLDFADDPDAERPADVPDPVSVDGVIGIHPELDLALLRLGQANGSGTRAPLRLMSQAPPQGEPLNLYVLGYPARNLPINAALQRSIFGDRYNVKRLQPGAMMAPPAGARVDHWGPCSSKTRMEHVLFHDASTLGGNSGSCVVDLDANQVIGLHFGGQYMSFNVAVALWRLRDDPLLAGADLNWD